MKDLINGIKEILELLFKNADTVLAFLIACAIITITLKMVLKINSQF